jgi:hypothetical protein
VKVPERRLECTVTSRDEPRSQCEAKRSQALECGLSLMITSRDAGSLPADEIRSRYIQYNRKYHRGSGKFLWRASPLLARVGHTFAEKDADGA